MSEQPEHCHSCDHAHSADTPCWPQLVVNPLPKRYVDFIHAMQSQIVETRKLMDESRIDLNGAVAMSTDLIAAPVVAEVRRAPLETQSREELLTLAACLQVIIDRLTAERDELREQGGQLSCQRDVARAAYEDLRGRLRGLEQQTGSQIYNRIQTERYSSDAEDRGQGYLEACSQRYISADQIATLFATPEQPE
jgi:hypothetical protein